LTWSASGATSYYVGFGATNPPGQVSANQSAASYSPGSLATNTTYFWQITAANASGSTAGPVWSFTTTGAASAAAPQPPSAPNAPTPASGATQVATTPTLTWSASGATSYDVGFGATNPPGQVSANQGTASYAPEPLTANTTYFWRVTARNADGATAGPVWSFTTGSGGPPATPNAPSPASGAIAVTTSPILTWSASGATGYYVGFGTSNPPGQVSMNQSAASYAPGTLSANTTYFWQITAVNASGAKAGPVWSFTTGPSLSASSLATRPPSVTPASLITNRAIGTEWGPRDVAGSVGDTGSTITGVDSVGRTTLRGTLDALPPLSRRSRRFGMSLPGSRRDGDDQVSGPG
jgi:hypothetical protein